MTMVGAVALSAGIVAVPNSVAAETLRMQALLNVDGSGYLYVNNPWPSMSWEACSATLSDCVPFGADQGGGALNTAGASPGTVFRVTSGESSVGLSPLWTGNVASLSAPSVDGPIRANERVTPIAGQWQGGWGGEGDFLQLAACRDRQGTRCTTLTDSHYVDSCPDSSAVLDPAFVGDYLRVADQRRGAGPHITLLYASGSPYAARGGAWEESPVTSVAVVGRIAAPSGPRTDRCGFPPLNEASIAKNGVARVQCGLGCRAVLVATRRGRKVRLVRKLSPWRTYRRPATMRLSRRSLARIGTGRARLIVKIDGRRIARRTVVLGLLRESRQPHRR